MKTAIVILNWNGSSMLRRFLPSVVAHAAADSEVWVADNASTDNSLEVLAAEFPTVKTLRLDRNWGFAEGYNKSLAQIPADYYVLLNSDVEVTPHWLEPLTDFLDAHPEVAAVQPKLLKASLEPPSPGEPASFEYAGAAGGFIDKHGYPFCRGRLFDVVEDDRGQYDQPMEVHWATGACMVVRAADYRAAGGLDGRFFAHNEEIDLCWRLRIMGKRIMCLPASRVYHLGGGTLPQGNPRKTYLNFRNNLTMLYKNLPDDRLAPVMRIRRLLDYVAVAQALAKGNIGDVKAIIKARRDFNKWKNEFNNDRMKIQTTRTLAPSNDLAPLSLLWQFFARGKKTFDRLPAVLSLLIVAMLALAPSAHADDKTRGIGVYPGRPAESFAASAVATDVYHNLTVNHAAYHSSSYDFNLTAQLVTDGLAAQAPPAWMEVLANGRPLSVRERDWAFNGNEWSGNSLQGAASTYEIRWHGMKVEVDSIFIDYTVVYHADQATSGYEVAILCGDQQLARESMSGLPGPPLHFKLNSDPNKQDRQKDVLPACRVKKGYALAVTDSLDAFKMNFNMPGAEYWRVCDIRFFYQGKAVDTQLLSSSRFQSVWMSAAGGDQWVYVDMGAEAEVDKVRLYWREHIPQGRLELSDDARTWTAVASLPTDKGAWYEVDANNARGRYIRVFVEGYDKPYQLVELEALGRGGTVAQPHAEAAVEGDKWLLHGGDWRLQRASEVTWPGEVVSLGGFPVKNWLPATVPGTVLTSYVNAGAVADQGYDDNIYYTSESFFNSNVWYRREFTTPKEWKGKRIYLNLDGINWKAQLWLNGRKVGRVEGAFHRGRFDITSLLSDERNVLAIEIERVAHPGSVKQKNSYSTDINGGLLGYDNPTFHASIGWDWITSVRGREIGIWNDIFLTAEHGLSLADPLVTTTLNLPDTLATLRPQVHYNNDSGRVIRGKVCGWVGNLRYEKPVTVNPGNGVFSFLPDDHDQLRNQRLRLWWPNGYGEPYLYDAGFCFVEENGDTLASITFKQGIRQMSYKDKSTRLTVYVNGRRVVPLGGNWGFSEHNLNFRGREYDVAARYHRDMNFNMIRHWVGQIGDDEFYQACDKYGIMVWQDFWLANPADGPDPADENMFMRNAYDLVSRIRHHASVALYCGRNEGYPPASLNYNLENLVKSRHPGIEYIPSSADDGVGGRGPYWALPIKEYFERQTGLLHSERGMPNVMTYDGLRRTLRPEHLWPQNDRWGQHDYTMAGAQKGATFNTLIAQYGDIDSAERFSTLGQFVNYDGYRGMFESGSADRMGLLLWMSHSCWPSMTWQCYDYYFEPTAAYFGCKKACEPLHIQFNALTHEVEVVNLGIGDRKKLTTEVAMYDINGRRLGKIQKGKVSSVNDSRLSCGVVDTTGVALLRLRLLDGKRVVSENTYLLDAAALQTAPKVDVDFSVEYHGTSAVVTLQAPADAPAYMLRLNLKDNSGEQILPVIYSDNYFHLLPGERKTVTISWQAEDQRTPGAQVELSGYNTRMQAQGYALGAPSHR